MKTLELHGAIPWIDTFLRTLLVDRDLTSSVFCENLVSLTLENVAINAKELVDFVESFVLPRPKKERLEKFLNIDMTTNFYDGEVGITPAQLERLTESLRYDASDVFPERFNRTSCVTRGCEGICQFGQDTDGWAEPFLCPACGEALCEKHRDAAETLCTPNPQSYNYDEHCHACESSLLCMREGCPFSTSKYIDDRTISCVCGTRYALGHAPDEWLDGLDTCVEQECGKNLCSRDYYRILCYEGGQWPSFSCSICEKIWCSDHVPPGSRSCQHCQEKMYGACPSCIQEHKESGEHFKQCKCKSRFACNSCAEIIFVCSRDEGFEIRQLWCSKCRSRDYVILESDSDDGCWSDGDEVYQKDFEKRQIARERQVKDEMDEYCL